MISINYPSRVTTTRNGTPFTGDNSYPTMATDSDLMSGSCAISGKICRVMGFEPLIKDEVIHVKVVYIHLYLYIYGYWGIEVYKHVLYCSRGLNRLQRSAKVAHKIIGTAISRQMQPSSLSSFEGFGERSSSQAVTCFTGGVQVT